jgi:hypothetical protein
MRGSTTLDLRLAESVTPSSQMRPDANIPIITVSTYCGKGRRAITC